MGYSCDQVSPALETTTPQMTAAAARAPAQGEVLQSPAEERNPSRAIKQSNESIHSSPSVGRPSTLHLSALQQQVCGHDMHPGLLYRPLLYHDLPPPRPAQLWIAITSYRICSATVLHDPICHQDCLGWSQKRPLSAPLPSAPAVGFLCDTTTTPADTTQPYTWIPPARLHSVGTVPIEPSSAALSPEQKRNDSKDCRAR